MLNAWLRFSVSYAASMVPRGSNIGPTFLMGPSPWPSWNAQSHGHLHKGLPLYIHTYIVFFLLPDSGLRTFPNFSWQRTRRSPRSPRMSCKQSVISKQKLLDDQILLYTRTIWHHKDNKMVHDTKSMAYTYLELKRRHKRCNKDRQTMDFDCTIFRTSFRMTI